jgi:hypothetical protein
MLPCGDRSNAVLVGEAEDHQDPASAVGDPESDVVAGACSAVVADGWIIAERWVISRDEYTVPGDVVFVTSSISTSKYRAILPSYCSTSGILESYAATPGG